jgi:hypothetical protein
MTSSGSSDAGSGNPERRAPEWAEVMERVVRTQRRRSRTGLAAVGMLALVAGAAGGAVAARQVDGEDAAPATTVSTTTSSTTTTAPEPTTTTSIIPTLTVAPPPVDDTVGIENQIFQQQLLDPLFVERFDRYTVRVLEYTPESAAMFNPFGVGPDGDPLVDAPAICTPRMISVQVSAGGEDDGVAGAATTATDVGFAEVYQFPVGGDVRYASSFGGASAITQAIGVSQRWPGWLAVVPVADTQRAAKVAFPNGVVVDAVIRDGFAIAALADDDLDWRSANNAARIQIDLGEGLEPLRKRRPNVYEECRPPAGTFGPAVRLPDPGEQPTDPTAARAGIEDALLAFTDPSASIDDRVAVVADPGDLADILKANNDGGFGFQPSAAIIDLVFTSPTEGEAEVWVWQGIAVDFVERDGEWKITRESACTFLSSFSQGCFRFDENGEFVPFATTIALAPEETTTTAAPETTAPPRTTTTRG